MSLILEKLEGLSGRHTLKIQRPWFSASGQREVTLEVLAQWILAGGGDPVTVTWDSISGVPAALTAYATVDVAAYGASPSASAATNATAFATALANAGIVYVTTPGTYSIGSTLVIKARTTLILSPGVVLQRSSVANVSFIRNENATSIDNTVDSDITIIGYGARIAVNSSEGSSVDVPGTRAHLNFYNVARLNIVGLTCTDLGATNFFIQIANWADVEIRSCYITGTGSVKDAIHVNGGENLRIVGCKLITYDDAIALNAWDYATLSPRLQPIRNVFVSQTTMSDPGTRTGYASRLLPGAWAAWTTATSYQLADTVNNGGYQYRMTNAGPTSSSVAPTHTSTGVPVTGADGITWRCCGVASGTTAEIENVVFDQCEISTTRSIAAVTNSDANGRSIFPGVTAANRVQGLTISRLKYRPLVANSAPIVAITVQADDINVTDTKLIDGYMPNYVVTVGAITVGRIMVTRLNAIQMINGLITVASGGKLYEIEAVDCTITGLNNGSTFQASDGLITYIAQANTVDRITVRGGRYDWITSLYRAAASNTCEVNVIGARFLVFRRLVVGTAGTSATSVVLTNNYFESAATSGLMGATVSTQTIDARMIGNIFAAASTVISDTTGASRIRFADTPVVTASLAGAAAGDLVRTASGWQEYNGSAWGAVRN